jgi:hypothetical protein
MPTLSGNLEKRAQSDSQVREASTGVPGTLSHGSGILQRDRRDFLDTPHLGH